MKGCIRASWIQFSFLTQDSWSSPDILGQGIQKNTQRENIEKHKKKRILFSARDKKNYLDDKK